MPSMAANHVVVLEIHTATEYYSLGGCVCVQQKIQQKIASRIFQFWSENSQ